MNNTATNCASAAADYATLESILRDAYGQSAYGKGKVRHANEGQRFEEQPICVLTDMVGLGYPVGQLMKKAHEAIGMAGRKEFALAYQELLGVIVYAAAAARYVRNHQDEDIPALAPWGYGLKEDDTNE